MELILKRLIHCQRFTRYYMREYIQAHLIFEPLHPQRNKGDGKLYVKRAISIFNDGNY